MSLAVSRAVFTSPLLVVPPAPVVQQALQNGLRFATTRVVFVVAWLHDVVVPVLVDRIGPLAIAMASSVGHGMFALAARLLPLLGSVLLMVLATVLVMAVTLLYPTLQTAGRALRQDLTTRTADRRREPFPATRRLWDRIMIAAGDHQQVGSFDDADRYDENERYAA